MTLIDNNLALFGFETIATDYTTFARFGRRLDADTRSMVVVYSRNEYRTAFFGEDKQVNHGVWAQFDSRDWRDVAALAVAYENTSLYRRTRSLDEGPLGGFPFGGARIYNPFARNGEAWHFASRNFLSNPVDHFGSAYVSWRDAIVSDTARLADRVGYKNIFGVRSFCRNARLSEITIVGPGDFGKQFAVAVRIDDQLITRLTQTFDDLRQAEEAFDALIGAYFLQVTVTSSRGSITNQTLGDWFTENYTIIDPDQLRQIRQTIERSELYSMPAVNGYPAETIRFRDHWLPQ